MKKDNVKTAEAAEIIGASPQFVRIAMQQRVLPIGVAFKRSSKWCYDIQADKLSDYVGRDIRPELELIRSRKRCRVV